ncbi:MAG: TorF family putative porin [Burkholderiaceae bacterium]
MNKKWLAAALLVSMSPIAAEQALAQSEWTFEGNAGLYSDYRFRGFTQTAYKPAFQGGFDLKHSSGFYVGNWNSNVEAGVYNGASLEMDFYAGYGGTAGGLDYDVGVLYYAYPTSAPGSAIDNTEIYAGISAYGFGLKYSYGVSDFFGVPNSDGNSYLQLSYGYDIGNGWSLSAAIGYQDPAGALADKVTDYSLGVAKDIGGWSVGATIVGVSDKALATTSASSEDAGKTGLVLSVSKSF